MKYLTKAALTIAALGLSALQGGATGWPANYQGVMLQGFYWDSYKETKWTNLTSQADELSKYFKLIWVPNSAQSAGMPTMGYMPIYYFTHHNSSFGTEAELRKMISTFRSKDVGIIEDVVINHRVGVYDWADFPKETWNGTTYSMDAYSVCSTDEWPQAKGAADTGDDFDGARDLDHTNVNVQGVLKNYCKFLLEDLGYAGFRLDMVKGYGGQYTKIYNQYSKPQFSVGEYWDSSYDKVAAWIDATGKESAAFDFPCKYAINEAFNTGDMTKLVWRDPSGAYKPAGMIHYGYPQYSVTFIDNHDTYRDGSKFNDENHVEAANAFILFSPGTPCIFWPHYTQHKKAIQTLIDLRNEVGIHNLSNVTVLKRAGNCYAAEIEGTKGKAIVKIGPDMDYNAPAGYSLRTYGKDYCVWTSTSQSNNYPETVYMLGDINGYEWSTTQGVPSKGDKGVYRYTVTVDASDNGKGYFAFATVLGADWDVVNAGDRYGAPTENTPISIGETKSVTLYRGGQNASASQSWEITSGTYDIILDLKNMTVNISSGRSDENPDTEWTIFFDNSKSNWADVYLYAYGSSEALGGWPGKKMSRHSASDFYVLSTSNNLTGLNLIFSNDNGNEQTGDGVTAENYGIYQYNGPKIATGVRVGNYCPPTLYLMGHVNGYSWATDKGVAANGNDGEYTYSVDVDNSGDGYGYFSFATVLGKDWDGEGNVNSGHRYGASSENEILSPGNNAQIKFYKANITASGTYSWKVKAGSYKVTANLPKGVVSLNITTDINNVEMKELEETSPVYYNLQGVPVSNPGSGIYIVVKGNQVRKEIIK